MKLEKDQKRDIILIAISVVCLAVSFTLSISYISFIPVILCGIPIFKECIEGLVKEFDIKADLLVTIAIIASLIIGETFAAAEIATIMAIGGFLEEYTVSKTQEKIKHLISLTPQYATRIKNGHEEKIKADEIKIGDTLKILPGQTVPADGVINKGETSIDEKTLTGESLPADKKTGDKVYSGTINLYGSFTMKAEKQSKDSSLQRLVKLVKSSAPENSKIVREADKWATLIVAIAFTSAILTYLLTFEIIRAVTILVVFCPCALVLATPTAIMASIGNLTKKGILVKDGKSIEELATIDEVVFDKTGTLTHGKAKITEIITHNRKKFIHLLASIESKSQHPLAKAIKEHYNGDVSEVSDFKIHLGKGISGHISSSHIMAGNRKMFDEIPQEYSKKPKNGETEIFLAINGEIIGKVLLADTLRSNSKETINKLKQLNIKTTLLTGDNQKTAQYIANQVGINNVKANLLPEDKTDYIKNRQLKGKKIAMVGDGINDAPSLKKANVGIAMGGIGSDVSVEAANIALINDNIMDLPFLFSISAKTIKTIRISIAFALSVNIIAMALAILGVLNPIEGALIHNIGSVIVIVYSYMLTLFKPSINDFKVKKQFKFRESSTG